MNTELFNLLNDHYSNSLHVGEYGTTEHTDTRDSFGTIDNIKLPLGKYYYAYSDENEGLPCPMLCLELNEEMRELGVADCHQVRIWKVESSDLPFDDPFEPVSEDATDYSDICPGEPEVLFGLHHC